MNGGINRGINHNAYLCQQHQKHHDVDEERGADRQPPYVVVESQIVIEHEVPTGKKLKNEKMKNEKMKK